MQQQQCNNLLKLFACLICGLFWLWTVKEHLRTETTTRWTQEERRSEETTREVFGEPLWELGWIETGLSLAWDDSRFVHWPGTTTLYSRVEMTQSEQSPFRFVVGLNSCEKAVFIFRRLPCLCEMSEFLLTSHVIWTRSQDPHPNTKTTNTDPKPKWKESKTMELHSIDGIAALQVIGQRLNKPILKVGSSNIFGFLRLLQLGSGMAAYSPQLKLTLKMLKSSIPMVCVLLFWRCQGQFCLSNRL